MVRLADIVEDCGGIVAGLSKTFSGGGFSRLSATAVLSHVVYGVVNGQ